MNNPAQKSYQLYIGGEWVDASDGGTLDVYCPANGEQLSVIADATKEDVDRAVDAAWEAFETWSKTTKAERAIILNKVADLIEENAEKLALLESLDNGKPIRETRAIDVAYSVDHFRYFAGVLLADTGEADMLPGNMMSLVLHEPIGVVGQIVPWNFPFLMAAWKLAPVLAAGDCTVFKPSSTTSLTVLELAKLTEGVIPAGVFNVVTGRGSKSGQYILDNPKISKLAFTGSTEVGRDVARAAAERLIPATLELGGKSANIIFPDAKWDMMLDGIQLGILFNQGQVCCAGSRIFVHEDIYDKFVQDACEAFGKVKVGMPWEDDTQMGSQIDQNPVSYTHLVASSASIFHVTEFKKVALPAVCVSTVCICCAGLLVILDLGGVARIFNLIISPNFISPLFWDICVISCYLVINLVYLYFMTSKRADKSKIAIVSRFALPIAILVHTVTAWIFGLQIAREGWHSAIMGPLFVASAMDSGLALLLIALAWMNRRGIWETSKKLMGMLAGLLATCIAVDGYMVGCELLTTGYPGSEGGWHVLSQMFFGATAPYFWIEIIVGVLIPFTILVFAKNRQKTGLIVFSSSIDY